MWNPFRKDRGGSRRRALDDAVQLYRDGSHREALEILRFALKNNPGDAQALQEIAFNYTRLKQYDDAIKTYRYILKHHPSLPGPHYGLAFLLLRKGETSRAVDHLETFLAQDIVDKASSGWRSEAQEYVDFARYALEKAKAGEAWGADEEKEEERAE